MRCVGLAFVAVFASACFGEPDPSPGDDTTGGASSNVSGDDASTGSVGMSSTPMSEGDAESADDGGDGATTATATSSADSTAGDSADTSDGGDATTGAEEMVVLDLWAEACLTWDWTDQDGTPLGCPGTTSDEVGYVVPATAALPIGLGETGMSYSEGAIAIHPPFQAPSHTRGISGMPFQVEVGDTFRATVGCANVETCEVTIRFLATDGVGTAEEIWTETADGMTQELELDLSELAGTLASLQLTVESGDTSASDGTIFVNPRIVRTM